jgi:hypothetical protein
MIESSLFDVLSTAAAITSLVGTRVYPVVLPTDPTLPALVYLFVGGTGQPSFSTRGMQKARVEINCWGTSYSSAVTLREAVIQTLAGYSDENFEAMYMQSIDFFDHDLLQYRATAEFYIFYAA